MNIFGRIIDKAIIGIQIIMNLVFAFFTGIMSVYAFYVSAYEIDKYWSILGISVLSMVMFNVINVLIRLLIRSCFKK